LAPILREPEAAGRDRFDAIVVGGGIYGITLAVEAARRRLRVLLVERDDFGGATSRNHLRIIHGGFRYLQSGDLPRYFESVSERRWFLRALPDWIEPLPCLMPLYGSGVRRTPILRAGLLANDLLSITRNRGVVDRARLPGGRVVPSAEVRRLHPGVAAEGLTSGAIWYDAFAPDPPRVLMTLLHRACAAGVTALNYVEATGLLESAGAVAGIRAVDRVNGGELELRAPVVLNAAGPWCRELAERLDRDTPDLFRPTLAWNLLLDRPSLSSHALALTARRPGAQTLFLVPWKGYILAGTRHAPWSGATEAPTLTAELHQGFLDDLNEVAPELALDPDAVLRVYSGLLPGTRPGRADLRNRPVVLHHGDHSGPRGLWSVSGIKFTTARRVADRALSRCFPAQPRGPELPASEREPGRDGARRFGPGWNPETDPAPWREDLHRLVAEESVVHLDDLLMRRTSLADHPGQAEALAPRLCNLFSWDDARRSLELERLKRALAGARGR